MAKRTPDVAAPAAPIKLSAAPQINLSELESNWIAKLLAAQGLLAGAIALLHEHCDSDDSGELQQAMYDTGYCLEVTTERLRALSTQIQEDLRGTR